MFSCEQNYASDVCVHRNTEINKIFQLNCQQIRLMFSCLTKHSRGDEKNEFRFVRLLIKKCQLTSDALFRIIQT